MSARFLGRLALLLIVLVLITDVLRNLPGEAKPLGKSPDGFPWPTRGLGEISLGMEGRFLLDLEERIENGDGADRVPQMGLAGTDPRPRNGGMALRDAEIRSFGEGDQQGVVRVQVDAPEAWVPMSVAEDGTRELDRTQPWRFEQPVVLLPGLGGAQDFVVETEEAELDPLTNEVYCPGSFELRSAGLRFQGRGLRMTPEADTVRFGELDGKLSWELDLPEGGMLRGATDNGGELSLLSETEALLVMRASEQCWLELPEEASLPGRLETSGFLLSLFTPPEEEAPAEDEPVDARDATWAPRHLDGEGETFWFSPTQVLLGGTSAIDWNESGDMLGLLIDGPILARAIEPASGWNTARGGAHLDAESNELTLWDRVIARTGNASVYTDLARVDGEENLFAEGELVVATAPGLSFANGLESSRDDESLWLTDVVGFPVTPEVDRIQAPRMRVDADQAAEIPSEFVLSGQLDGEAWNFEGASLSSRLDSTGRQVATARGGVHGKIGEATWTGETLNLRDSRFALKGAPCTVEMPLESGGFAVGRAETATLAQGVLRLYGQPQVRVPAASLGLAGDFVTISARQVERQADGRWTFDHDIRFEGACQGEARRAEWWPDGRFRVERNRDDEILIAQMEDGSVTQIHARVIEGKPDGPLLLSSELDLRLHSEGEPQARAQGARAELRQDGGTIEGPVLFEQGERSARAQRVEWEGNPSSGPYVVYLLGNASFESPEGSGKAHRMLYDSEEDALELFRGRRPAWLLLQGTRDLTADWIRAIVGERLIESRNGRVTPHQSDDDRGVPR